jgi:hypothetical protein
MPAADRPPPGRALSSTPAKPMATATQRTGVIFSPSSGPASRATMGGAANSTAVVSASGMTRKAAMAKQVTPTRLSPRST